MAAQSKTEKKIVENKEGNINKNDVNRKVKGDNNHAMDKASPSCLTLTQSPMAHNATFNEQLATMETNDKGDKVNRAPTTMNFLLMRWEAMTSAFLPQNSAIWDEWFHRLWVMHTEDTRHYHTVVHLEEMLRYLELVPEMLDMHAQQALTLATFFHDAVYDALSATNEEDSAALFESFAQDVDNLPKEVRLTTVDLIRATKAHQVSPDNSYTKALFLDMDMAVLGKRESAYQAYAGLIRKEYHFVPHEAYCRKRADILEDFCKQPAIFGTPLFQEAFEERAHSNLRTEIALLRQGTIPG